jgi:high-affinity K+ transport system ATPase subunit B
MPTTIGGLLPAIGIAGMDRLLQHNFIAMSGRAVEAAGDVDVVLMDKTGTITLGNRMATEFLPAEGTSEKDLVNSTLLASLADDTPEEEYYHHERSWNARPGHPCRKVHLSFQRRNTDERVNWNAIEYERASMPSKVSSGQDSAEGSKDSGYCIPGRLHTSCRCGG